MKSVCHTSPSIPSQSLVKCICYPESFIFQSKQTTWGCEHEKTARDRYEAEMKQVHTNFSVKDSGLIINPKWPFIGATPDGSVSCTCCGKGVMEIKCPYCHHGESIADAAEDKNFCLEKDSNGLYLKHAHAYYYQIQTQLFVSGVDYCDICVCTFSSDDKHDIHIEHIIKDEDFWTDCVSKAHQFFRTCILPELLGKWYTRPIKTSFSDPASSTSDKCDEPSNQSVYCYCNGPEEGEMIACDNEQCGIEWFHIKCLKISKVPKGKSKWYCPDCRKLPKFSRKKTKDEQLQIKNYLHTHASYHNHQSSCCN